MTHCPSVVFFKQNLFACYRTFLTTVEIVVICVFTVLFVFLLIGLCIYLCIYGCTKAPWCHRSIKDYSQIQLQRERKIGEIWKNEKNGIKEQKYQLE